MIELFRILKKIMAPMILFSRQKGIQDLTQPRVSTTSRPVISIANRVFKVVVLMVVFRGPVVACRGHFGGHLQALLGQNADELFGDLFLLLRRIEYCGSVLGSDVNV